MIKKAVVTSRKFNLELKSDLSRLCWVLMIPFADVKGRIDADPIVIKGMIFPLRNDVSVDDVEEALRELDSVGLIQTFKVGKKLFAEIYRFRDFQSIREDREASSAIPEPPTTSARSENLFGSKSKELDALVRVWNETPGLQEFKWTSMNISGARSGPILEALEAYTVDELSGAIQTFGAFRERAVDRGENVAATLDRFLAKPYERWLDGDEVAARYESAADDDASLIEEALAGGAREEEWR